MKSDIQNREDLSLLIDSFYSKIRTNGEIGHFFNETIKDWDSHLEKLLIFGKIICLAYVNIMATQ